MDRLKELDVGDQIKTACPICQAVAYVQTKDS